MQVADTRAAVREAVAAARQAGKRIALVPTMGYLHAGHLSLIDRGRELAEWVGVSVFVNPLQFGPSEDLDRYPRALERDIELAGADGADLLFAPSSAEMYADGEPWVTVVPQRGADRLCGRSRPGHFRGVLTVVAKLLGISTPDLALFGQKDYQQAALIRRMVSDLEMNVGIEVVPTVRDLDGLAMSSRNTYLSAEERARALSLWRGLQHCQALFSEGEADAEVLRAGMMKVLTTGGIEVEYAEVVEPLSLEPLTRAVPGAVCAVAGRAGTTRLIDNLILEGNADGRH